AVAADDVAAVAPEGRGGVRGVWASPRADPSGAVLDAAALRRTGDAARDVGAGGCGDECYAELGWDGWDGGGVACVRSDGG
ncbi:succinyldiaminopimelate transaminase, partial [Micrococcus sp. SIMBA_144]